MEIPTMYFSDLTPYTYLQREPDPNVVNVGWLNIDHEFPKGPVPNELLQKILLLCFRPVNSTRGIHPSPFIPRDLRGYPVEYEGRCMALGSAEIRVVAIRGRVYAAPNLIYHYIKDCSYLPPQEFLDALQAMPA
jgi:hypothetical protein